MRYLFILSLLVFVSCNEDQNVKTEAVEHTHKHSDEIVLNGDQKWQVDTNMMVFIRNMESDINDCDKKKNSDDFSGLAESLEDNLDKLTSNCTMTGQAHDELHKWLLPYMDVVNEFSEAKTEGEKEALYNELKEAFVQFNLFFE